MTKEKSPRKREGFEGQRLIVIPKKIVSEFLVKDPVTRQIYVTDIGFYPKAMFHYAERLHGISQHIIIYCIEGYGWIEINKNAFKSRRLNLSLFPQIRLTGTEPMNKIHGRSIGRILRGELSIYC